MRARWSDPSYRWANDSDLRRSKQGRPRENEKALQAPRHEVEQLHSGGSTTLEKTSREEGEN